MSVGCRLGFLSASAADIYFFNKLIKQDIPRSAQWDGARAGSGRLQSTVQSQKAMIHLEGDHMTDAELGNLRKVLWNRNNPHKIFYQFPAVLANQDYVFDAASNEAYTGDDNAGTLAAGATEFTGGEYTNINAWDANAVSYATIADAGVFRKYGYFFFEADISNFVSAYGVTRIERITIALKNLYLTDGQGDIGFIIEAYNNTLSEWCEIERQGLTKDADNTFYASIRPTDCFTSFDDFLNTNFVLFRIRNLYASRDTTQALNIQADFAKIFVNAYGCVWNEDDNFTYRESYTGAGWTGNVELAEL